MAEINVTNLVDVTIVLMIIFMISAPLLRNGINVQLPKMKNGLSRLQKEIVVSYTHDNLLFIDDEKIQDRDFEAILSSKWKSSGGHRVLLNGDKEVSYGKIVVIMDRIKGAGIAQIGLVVDPDRER